MKNLILSLSFLLLTSTAEAWDVSSACVGFWKLNENAANSTVDDTQNTAAGTMEDATGNINTSTVATTGKINGAFAFTGSTNNRRVDAGNNFNYGRTQAMSIEVWVQTSTSSGEMLLVGKIDPDNNYRGYQLYVNAGKPGFLMNYQWSGDAIDRYHNTSIADGNWHHLVTTYDGSADETGIKVYIDGNESTNYACSACDLLSNDPAVTSPFSIGIRQGSTGTNNIPFTGNLDNVRIYNRVLTADEVTGLYNSGNGTENLASATTRRRPILIQ